MAIADDISGIQSAVNAELNNPTGCKVFCTDISALMNNSSSMDNEPEMTMNAPKY